MKRLIIAISMALMTTACPVAAPPLPAGSYQQGELLVQFDDATTTDRAKEIHVQIGATPLQEVIPGIWRSGVPAGSERDWIPRFRVFHEVRFAELNARIHHQMVGGFTPYRPFKTQVAVTDPRFEKDTAGLPSQWGLKRLGICETGGCSLWDKSNGAGIKVAVIDTGIDAEHPDLKDSLDPGRNFVEEGTLPDDDFGHGTHVAGIIAASLNGRGVVGVAPKARIIPIRVLGVDGGTTATMIAGLSFAVQQGARVVNLSLGSAHTSQIEANLMAKVISKDIVVVAAAGNEALSGNPLEFPAAIPGVISVAATRINDAARGTLGEHADFSNFNPFNSVSAPGVDILSTVPRRFFLTTGNPADDGGAYAYASGTSMASPMVTGVVALMLAAHPEWKPTDVRQRLQKATIDLGDAGFDDFYGWGLVNAPSAIQ